MHVHFIAIGGAAMHNLAIALSRKGIHVTGSDDAIFDPSKSRLQREGLLPDELGWHPDRLSAETEAVIVGMHARADNPELARAKELGLATYSYPEYIYNATQDKRRTVIGGSHGKTSTTAMILHVLKACGMDPDYMVGAQLEGFDCMVKLSDAAKGVVLEGDEYLASPLDRRPKFHLYKPHVAVLTGVAWDHVNVFPTWDGYVEQFSIFIDTIEEGGVLIYSEDDPTLHEIVKKATCTCIPYKAHPHRIEKGFTYLDTGSGEQRIEIFGEHNLMNLSAAMHVCEAWDIKRSEFYTSIASFTGASRRLERLATNDSTTVYQDFAHSPSKVSATTQAVKAQFPERTLVAALELHTFSSLSSEFLKEYKGAMDDADVALVAFNPEAVAHKRLPEISAADVLAGFDREDLKVFTHPADMIDYMLSLNPKDSNFLIMSSGDLGGRDIIDIAGKLIG